MLSSLTYRYINGSDISYLLYSIGKVLQEFKSLEHLFIQCQANSYSLKCSLTKFVNHLKSTPAPDFLYFPDRKRNLNFLLPSPEKGSACKRLHLFLRWMVRHDLVDLGLWKSLSPSSLLIPADTHVARVSKLLSLTEKASPTWSMAEEITDKLLQLNPTDPIKYDFSLFGLGVHSEIDKVINLLK